MIEVEIFLFMIQALDSMHRGSVAKLLGSFAIDSQIIATTFRPELLPFASNIIGCNWDNQVR